MFILIIGCGRTGSKLAGILSSKEHDVVIIDRNSDKFRKLSAKFSGFTIEGDALEQETLEKGKIKEADLVIVTTGNDYINYFLSELALEIYSVNNIYVRIKDPTNNKMLKNKKEATVFNPLDMLLDNILKNINKGEKYAD